MDQALTQLNNNVQGVVSSNDGNAGAAIAAMEEQGMAGTVPVSGLDCTVQAQQLILLGKQTQCGWRPLEDMAAAAAKVTLRLVNGEDFSAQKKHQEEFSNGNQHMFNLHWFS